MAVVDTREGPIRVEVPARADLVHILRAVAASVGARLTMPLDDVEEVRIAVDEAATVLLPTMDGTGSRFELLLTSTDDAIVVALTVRPPDPETRLDEIRRGWAWKVITGLCDEAAIERSPEGTTIRFRRSLSGRAR
jgi:serine/threonine-protein kinase RsbW